MSSFHGRSLDPITFSLVTNIAGWGQMGINSFGQCQWLILKNNPRCKWVRPHTFPLTLGELEALQKEVAGAVHFLSIPLIVNSSRFFEVKHIVHLLVNRERNQIEYFDSRGADMKTYSDVDALFRILSDPRTELIQNRQKVQYSVDCFNCGPLVLYYLEHRIGRGHAMNDLGYPEKGILHYRRQLALRLADVCAKNRDVIDSGWAFPDDPDKPESELPRSQTQTQC